MISHKNYIKLYILIFYKYKAKQYFKKSPKDLCLNCLYIWRVLSKDLNILFLNK